MTSRVGDDAARTLNCCRGQRNDQYPGPILLTWLYFDIAKIDLKTMLVIIQAFLLESAASHGSVKT